jgi:threonine dehydrogenase-like Zn-dependent dehydrogenase
MGRLLKAVQSGRFDPTPLLTHRFPLSEIGEAYRIFSGRLDGVLKIAVTP